MNALGEAAQEKEDCVENDVWKISRRQHVTVKPFTVQHKGPFSHTKRTIYGSVRCTSGLLMKIHEVMSLKWEWRLQGTLQSPLHFETKV